MVFGKKSLCPEAKYLWDDMRFQHLNPSEKISHGKISYNEKLSEICVRYNPGIQVKIFNNSSN